MKTPTKTLSGFRYPRSGFSKTAAALLSFIGLTLFASSSFAQIPVTVTNPTNTTPNLAASYASLAAALTDLNNVTAMTGPVTLTSQGFCRWQRHA
jgi:hypothetical protein